MRAIACFFSCFWLNLVPLMAPTTSVFDTPAFQDALDYVAHKQSHTNPFDLAGIENHGFAPIGQGHPTASSWGIIVHSPKETTRRWTLAQKELDNQLVAHELDDRADRLTDREYQQKTQHHQEKRNELDVCMKAQLARSKTVPSQYHRMFPEGIYIGTIDALYTKKNREHLDFPAVKERAETLREEHDRDNQAFRQEMQAFYEAAARSIETRHNTRMEASPHIWATYNAPPKNERATSERH